MTEGIDTKIIKDLFASCKEEGFPLQEVVDGVAYCSLMFTPNKAALCPYAVVGKSNGVIEKYRCLAKKAV